MTESISSYGVLEQVDSKDPLELAAESIRTVGFAVVEGGCDSAALQELRTAFETARSRVQSQFGSERLRELDEHNTIRAPLYWDKRLLVTALNTSILKLVGRLIGGYAILSQQNGIINPPCAHSYNQSAWHRDLPYQHMVLSRPVGLNALFCLDEFSVSNGATHVLPASHKLEAFPSNAYIAQSAIQVTAPAGAYIVMDCMTYHRGGANNTDSERRAINHLYTIPLIRQQIELPALLGDAYPADGATRRLLGYELRTPRSVDEYLASRGRPK